MPAESLRKQLRSIFSVSRSAKVGVVMISIIIGIVLIGPFFIRYSPYDTPGGLNSPPSIDHPFGTDYLGHDVLSQTVYGAYPSLLVGIGASFGSVIIGLVVGVLGGYFGKLETIFAGVTDVIMTLPAIPLLILIGLLFRTTDLLIVLLLTLVLWPPVARSIRAQVSSIKRMPFVEAAKTSGLSEWKVVYKVIMPEMASIAIAFLVFNVAVATVLVTALEFLGVGNPLIVSWGSILYWAQQFGFYAGDWWWILAPGLFITVIATGFAIIGFSIEEIMNPRLRS